jgi:hypothetical protein
VGEVGCLGCAMHAWAGACATPFTPLFHRLLHLDALNVLEAVVTLAALVSRKCRASPAFSDTFYKTRLFRETKLPPMF